MVTRAAGLNVIEGYSLGAGHPYDAVDTANRKYLRRVMPGLFAGKLAILGTLLVSVGFGVTLSHGFSRIFLQVCLGAVLAHATELIHQCLHRTATGRASRDQFFGMLIATPLGISFWRYLTDHFRHHKDVTRESFSYNYQRMESGSLPLRIAGFVRHVSMLDQFLETFKWMGLAITGRIDRKFEAYGPMLNKAVAKKIRRDYLIMAGLLSLALVVSLVFRTDLVVQLWLIPMIIGWAPIHALIELPEHWKCDTSSTDARLNTRSIRAGKLARWYVNNNCNHVGHHFDINVAMERLPDYESQLMAESPFRHFEESYPRFYYRFFRFLCTGKYYYHLAVLPASGGDAALGFAATGAQSSNAEL
jgi:fatty acid desaturase